MNKTTIEIAKLEINTYLLIETENSVYEIEIIDNTGTVNISGSTEFLETTKALLIGCEGHKGLLVRGRKMELAYEQDGRTCHMQTASLLSCKIKYKNWSYEVWDEDSCTSK